MERGQNALTVNIVIGTKFLLLEYLGYGEERGFSPIELVLTIALCD